MEHLPNAECAFEAESTSVQAARQFLAEMLTQWQREDVLWPALQAVSELATNCVLHARTDFRVEVRVLPDGAVRLAVADGADALPRQRHYGDDATTGRGVALVAGLARTWGVERRPAGKVVWCEIDDDAPSLRRFDDGAAEIDLDSFLGAEDAGARVPGDEPRVAVVTTTALRSFALGRAA